MKSGKEREDTEKKSLSNITTPRKKIGKTDNEILSAGGIWASLARRKWGIYSMLSQNALLYGRKIGTAAVDIFLPPQVR